MRKIVAEFLGTALLLVGVVGSGIMGDSLAQGNDAVALLANAIATGCMLFVIITLFAGVSGAYFNPAVTLAFMIRGDVPVSQALAYVAVQVLGAVLGVWLTHLMFDQPIVQLSTVAHRTGLSQWVSEVFATFGLLMVIFGGLRQRPEAIPTLVALYITGAYWFTSSTSFANPAVTMARSLTDTFAGILPAHVPAFVVAQCVGIALGSLLLPWVFAANSKT